MGDVRQIWVAGVKVGLFGLDEVLKQVAGETSEHDEGLGDRLLGLVSRSNYIAPGSRDAYKKALLGEFERFMGRDIPDGDRPVEVRVLGPGCPRCDLLMSEVMTVLAELQVAADIDHVTDMAAIAGFGPVATPALVIKGKVVSSGRVPSRGEIAKYLREVAR